MLLEIIGYFPRPTTYSFAIETIQLYVKLYSSIIKKED